MKCQVMSLLRKLSLSSIVLTALEQSVDKLDRTLKIKQEEVQFLRDYKVSWSLSVIIVQFFNQY